MILQIDHELLSIFSGTCFSLSGMLPNNLLVFHFYIIPKTILIHRLSAAFFLVEYKSLLFHLLYYFFFFDLPAELILSAILFPIQSPVTSAVFELLF